MVAAVQRDDIVVSRSPQTAAKLRKHIPALEKTAKAAEGAAKKRTDTAQQTLDIGDSIAGSFSSLWSNFHTAYETYSAALTEADQATAAENELFKIVLGVTLAIYTGFTAGPVLELITAQKVLLEGGGELIEVGLGKLTEPPDPAARKPPALTPEAMALEQSTQLVEIYKAGLKLQAGPDPGLVAHACQQVLTDIERHQRSGNRWSDDKIEKMVSALTAKDADIRAFEGKCEQSISKLKEHQLEASHTVQFQSAADIEHDLWIRWIADNKSTLDSWWYGRKIKAHLVNIGILGEGSGVRLAEQGFTYGDPEKVARARALRGQAGTAQSTMCKGDSGTVGVGSEIWQAVSANDVYAGDTVFITGLQSSTRPTTPYPGSGDLPSTESWDPRRSVEPTLIIDAVPKEEELNYSPDVRESTMPEEPNSSGG